MMLCVVLVCAVTVAFACFQAELPTAVLSARSLNLRATNNDKAEEGRTFQLHKAITLDSHEARYKGYYEQKVLKSVITDSGGLASFGEVDPGIYWIVAGADRFGVKVVVRNGDNAKRLWVKNFADGCLDVALENAD